MTKWYLGSMNDGLFIIDKQPSQAGTDIAPHVREDHPNLIINVTGLTDAQAREVVKQHNEAIDNAPSSPI